MLQRLTILLVLGVVGVLGTVSPASAAGAASPAPQAVATCAATVSSADPALAPSMRWNPCATLDLHQIEDCRGKVCYRFCTTGRELRLCRFRLILVPVWKQYRVGHKPAGCR